MAETPASGLPKKTPTPNPLTAGAVTRPVESIANEIDTKAIKRGELPPFIPVRKGESSFVPPIELQDGSPESEQAYQRIIDQKNPLGAQINRKAVFALETQKSYFEDLKKWDAQGIINANALPGGGSIPLGPLPTLHPKAEFLVNFGKTPKDILIGLGRAQAKAQHFAGKYQDDPRFQRLLQSADTLLKDPIALADAMSKAGGMFETKEEEEFFRSTAENPGSIEYDTSPFLLIQKMNLEEIGKSGTFHPSQLEAEMRKTGFLLNYKNPRDVKMWREFRKWNTEHPDQRGIIETFGENSVNALKMLTDAVINTGYQSMKSVGDPQIGWNPDFKDEKSKAEYQTLVLTLISAKQNGEVLKGFSEEAALDLVDKQFTSTGKVDWDFFDSEKRKQLPELWVQLGIMHKELDARGAFTAKKQGITQLVTLASAIVTGTIGMAGMGIDTGPDRWWSQSMAGISTMTSGLAESIGDVTGNPSPDLTIAERVEQEEMKRMNTAVTYSRWHHHLSTNGIFPSMTDTRYHQDASMFLTAIEGAGIVKGGLAAGKGVLKYAGIKTGGKGYLSFMENTGLQATREAMTTELRKLAAQGVDFTSATESIEIRRVISEIKDAAKLENGGKGIDDYEAIERAFNGTGKIKNPKNPNELIEVPRTTLNQLSQKISEKAAGVQTVRDAIARAAWAGKNIKYSPESLKTLAKARQILQDTYPDMYVAGIADNVIYDRMRRSSFPKGKGTGVINANELRAIEKEVGSSWKAIDPDGIAGLKRSGLGPVQIDYIHQNHLFTGATWLLKSGNWMAERLEEWNRVHGLPIAPVMTSARMSGPAGTSISTLQQGGFRAAEKYSWVGMVVPFLRMAGAVGEMGDFMMEFQTLNKVTLGGEFNSTLLAMRNKFNREKRALLIRKASISPSDWPAIQKELAELGETTVREVPQTTASSVNVAKELALIEKQYDNLNVKDWWAHNLSSWSRNGAVAGATKLFRDASVGAATNEAFFGMFSGMQGIGNGTGFALFGTGVNSISSGWVTHFTKNKKLQERMTYDLDELRARMSDNVGVEGDVQNMYILKALTQAKDNAEVIRKKSGDEAADTFLAREVFTMANLFRIGATIELTDAGVRHGLVSLMESLNLANPEHADKLRDHYMSVATRQGLTGETAVAYANQMIEQTVRNNAAGVRRGSISKERGILEARLQKLKETTGKEVDEQALAAEQIARDAGMSPDSFLSPVETIVPFVPEPYPTPKPISPNATPVERRKIEQENLDRREEVDNRNKVAEVTHRENIDRNATIGGIPTAGLPENIVKKLRTFREEVLRIKELQRKNNFEALDITKKLEELDIEAKGIEQDNPIAEYRDGAITMGPDGAFLTSFKNGITVWEQNGKVRIYLDKDKFSTADAREEISHALFYTENMRDSRAYLRNIIFGQYEVNQDGQRVLVKGPLLGGTVEKSVAMLDMFIDAHATTMSDAEGASFKARWEQGKVNIGKNPDDTRLLQAGFIEFAGRLYQARMELANPQFGRMGQQGSSKSGSLEYGNIPIGQEGNNAQAGSLSWFLGKNASISGKLEPKARLLMKLVVGDLTVNDIINDGNPINGTDVDFSGKGPDKLKDNAKATLAENVRMAANFLKIFKVNGAWDGMLTEYTKGKLQDLGFFIDDAKSTPDLTFYKTGVIRNPMTGELNPIDPIAMRWAEQMIIGSRNRGGKIDTWDIFSTESVFARENDSSPEAKNQRWQWALASGRPHFINPDTLMFKKSLDKLMHDEWKPLQSLVDRVIIPKMGEGEDWSGLTVRKTVDGRTVLIGAPNLAQTKRILEHIKTEYKNIGSEGNQAVMENLGIFMEAIANGNMFDPGAPKDSRGWTQVFMAEYEGATQGVGEGTTKRTKNTHVQQRLLVPMRLVIRPSGLDVSGKKYADGEVTDHIYVEMLDMVALGKSTRNGWNNLIFDETGTPYWGTKEKGYKDGKQQLQDLFHGRLENLNEGINIVLTGYQQGGNIARATGPTAQRPPNESWELLMPLARHNPGDAKLMASAINRILGFTRTEFVELNGLEQMKVKEMSAAQVARRDELREKFDPENEDDRGFSPLEGISAAEKKLARLYGEHPNSLGGERMRDTQNPFSLFRIDRFQGTAVPHMTNNGPSKVQFNQFTQGWGAANFSSKNWVQMTPEDITSNQSLFNMQGQNLTEGYLHKSGYSIFRQERILKGGKRPDGTEKPDVIKKEYLVFDPTRGLAGRNYNNKETAFDFAESHSLTLTLPPERANVLELALRDEGWLPKGINFAGTIRDTFVSKDGKWQAERKVYNGKSGYQLVDINSGLVIFKGISVGFKSDGLTPNVKDLNAAIQAAKEGNMVEIAVADKFEKDVKGYKHPTSGQLGLADYFIVHGDTGAPDRRLIAKRNPIYYEMRKRFAESMGWDAVNTITKLMRKELGDTVVDNDHKAVSDWVEKWTNEWSAEKLKEMTSEASKEAKFELEQILEDKRAVDRLNLGQAWAWSRPKKPAGVKPNASQEARDKFEQAQKDYLQEAIEWDKQNRAIRERPIDEDEIASLVAYAKGMKARQGEFDGLLSVLGGLSNQANRIAEGKEVAGKLAQIRNSMREGEVSGEATFYVNKMGFIIQQLMPKASGFRSTSAFGLTVSSSDTPTMGLEVNMPTIISQQTGSLDILGKRVLGKGDPTDIRKATFVIYNGANIIARTNSLEDAQEAVNKASRQAIWMKRFIAEGSGLDSGPIPESMRERPAPEGGVYPANRYNKPAPR